ncbi:PAS/PAC sensor signal transduction histidine kinase [Azospirillum baldaniorum]|uniref:sensor histidine kinase n=1 Tax=Azospirillum baldaniorum TaxID=1064539 RepID=UPI00119F13D7|nr:PAS domain S-box protein [Azospirillum baldaniorum]TWA72172.1 PAS/PAC sensor signal transduction histidine kinase [Azospirillum baldaniorum]
MTGGAASAAHGLGQRGPVQAMPIVAMALVVLLFGVFLWVLHRSEREEETLTLIKDVLWVEQNLHFQLTSDEEKLQYLAESLGREDTTPVNYSVMARHIVTVNPAIQRVVRLDPQGRPVRSEPPVDDGPALDDAFGPSPRADAFLIARSSGRRAYSAPYRLGAADTAFEIVIPIFRGDQFAGALAGVLSIDALLTHHVPWWFAQRYQLEVIDPYGAVLGTKSRIAMPEPRRSHVVPFDPPGHGLTLVATLHQLSGNLGRNILIAAIFALTVSALWSLWAVRRHIARRIRAEEALRAEHAFRKAMEDSLTVGMRARDLDGRIIYVNPAFCRMVGWSAEELVGAGPIMPYWLPEDLVHTEEVFRAVLAGNAPANGFELRFRRANGERFDALIYEAPLIDAKGRHTGWMGSVLDITERKRAEELARQQQERLQQTARLITMGEMASTLAHELNQPLSAIASYCTGCLNRLQAGSIRPDELATALEKLSGQAKRAGQIIRRIHDFVRKSEPNVAPCCLSEVLEDCVALMEADARQQGVKLVLEMGRGLPAVMADRILLQQVVVNLMRNGIEAMASTRRDRRRLSVTVQAMDGSVLTRIQDRGCGISPENAEKLFSPFFTTKTEGMGMGLNICRSIIEHHQGRLWFEPAADGGTVFLFSLPVLSAPSLSGAAMSQDESPQDV